MDTEQAKFTFFWKNKSPFSQWYGSWMNKDGEIYDGSLIVDGETYMTAEHYMMAGKARLFGDVESLYKIMRAKHPREAKKLGRSVKNFDKSMWEQNCQQIVFDGNYVKFTQHDDLKKELLTTGESLLVEASPLDAIWGIGLDEREAREMDHEMWPGQNLLGQVLTRVREKIKEDERARRD